MNNRTLMLSLLASVLLSSCIKFESRDDAEMEPKAFTQIEKISWLVGRWENKSDEGELSETWQRKNDSVLSAETYFVTGGDTVFSEHVELVQSQGKLEYIVRTPGQNQGVPVMFTATKVEQDNFTFENSAHDYPSKIEYRRPASDSVVAEISGMQKGVAKSEQFKMRKVR